MLPIIKAKLATVVIWDRKISMPENKDFCLYALHSAIPFLTANQRKGHSTDWMETDYRVTCPDYACKLSIEIDRENQRVLNHDDMIPISWVERK